MILAAYSSGVSELLAHIFRKETGQDLEDYARNHLFEPLGIHEYHWKRSPLGEVDSEGGLFLPDYALAKIGELYRHLGVWHGERLLGEDWVRDSVTPRTDPGDGFATATSGGSCSTATGRGMPGRGSGTGASMCS